MDSETLLAGMEKQDGGIKMEAGSICVLMHREIDHDRTLDYTKCCMGRDWENKSKKLLSKGWEVFHIQTEDGGFGSGHETWIYLAKMEKG